MDFFLNLLHQKEGSEMHLQGLIWALKLHHISSSPFFFQEQGHPQQQLGTLTGPEPQGVRGQPGLWKNISLPRGVVQDLWHIPDSCQGTL